MKKSVFTAFAAAAAVVGGLMFLQTQAHAEHEEHHHAEAAPAETAAPDAAMVAPSKPQLIYSCTPDSFKLTQDGDNYTLTTTLETPTPNFSYNVIDAEDKNGRIKATLQLLAPEGMQLTVIDKIDIMHTFEHEATLHALSMKVEKNFNWGPEAVNCTHQ